MFGVVFIFGLCFLMFCFEVILEEVCEWLDGVVLECLDWCDLFVCYDIFDILFYLDLLYFGGELDYGKGMFVWYDFWEMVDMFVKFCGVFVLSINDGFEICDIFLVFYMEEVVLIYIVSLLGFIDVCELLISNCV